MKTSVVATDTRPSQKKVGRLRVGPLKEVALFENAQDMKKEKEKRKAEEEKKREERKKNGEKIEKKKEEKAEPPKKVGRALV